MITLSKSSLEPISKLISSRSVAKSSRVRPQGKKPRKRTVRTLRSFFPENEIRELCSTLQKNSDFEIGSSQLANSQLLFSLKYICFFFYFFQVVEGMHPASAHSSPILFFQLKEVLALSQMP
jgi:hypothetical protein